MPLAKKTKRWLLASYTVLTVVAWLLFSVNKSLADSIYGNGIYPLIRRVLDICFGWIPISFYWVVWVLAVGGLIYFIFMALRSFVFRRRVGRRLWSLGLYVFYLVTTFMWFWGFNYKRPIVKERLNLELKGVGAEPVFAELVDVIDTLNVLRSQIDDFNYDISSIQPLVEQVLDPMQYRLIGRGQIRQIHPKGLMLRFSAAGMYMPYLGEGNIDAGLHPIQKPFISAHEMSHVYGVTEEGECNFTGLLACLQSKDPFVRYSGWVGYFRYLASSAIYLDRERYNTVRSSMSDLVLSDLKAIRANSMKYPDIMPQFRDVVYDSYLKSQGVRAGMKSYNEIVMLKIAYDQQIKTD